MTPKTKVVLILLVLVLCYFTYFRKEDKTFTPTTYLMPATFTWETGPSNAVNEDGQPKTNVYVKTTYANGVVEQKLVDVESGCNELPEAEKDGAVFQCYAAGAGYKYKVIKGDGSYEVQRKRFEEGVPGKTPKVFEYETVAEFSPSK
ncbi:MAG: hypothetical protein V4686_03230 [Patescibacteria group bacterium]